MKFEIGDETDQALTTTLVHELVLCKDSFERFAALAKMNIMGRRDKATKIKCHDAYASFLHHLYEFYVGCIKRDFRSTETVQSRALDQIFNREVTKLLKNRVDAIKGGVRAVVGKSYFRLSSGSAHRIWDAIQKNQKQNGSRKHQTLFAGRRATSRTVLREIPRLCLPSILLGPVALDCQRHRGTGLEIN